MLCILLLEPDIFLKVYYYILKYFLQVASRQSVKIEFQALLFVDFLDELFHNWYSQQHTKVYMWYI